MNGQPPDRDFVFNMGNSAFTKPLRLVPRVQHYHWGVPRDSSLVGRLARGEVEDAPYAELWLGAHPDLPSAVSAAVPCNLKQLIDDNPSDMLGNRIIEQYGLELPFLFKVLSVGRPLSIQAHPDKKLAARLFRDKHYPDDHHKPEIAIALSETEILCGFRHLSDMAVDFARLPELRRALGEELFEKLVKRDSASEQQILKEMCNKLLNIPKGEIGQKCQALLADLKQQGKLCHRDNWVYRLLTEFFPEGDVGAFVFYTMNLVTLKSGTAIFVPPNTAHAYLSGELAECMANSDNVVRGGLTPKKKDVETLIAMLDYKACVPNIIHPDLSSSIISYMPPPEWAEFCVRLVGNGAEILVTDDDPAIVLALDASGHFSFGDEKIYFNSGDSFFIPAALGECRMKCEEGRCFVVTVPALSE